MYLISIGYPIGVKGIDYVTEIDNSHKVIPGKDALIWMEHQGITEIQECTESINNLLHIGALSSGNDMKELYKRVCSYKLARQGCGSADGNKHAIYLGEKIFHPTELQNDIWKLSNSKRSISEIMMLLQSKNNNQLTHEYFFRNLDILLKENLIFLV